MQVPKYENATKRMQNIMLETTTSQLVKKVPNVLKLFVSDIIVSQKSTPLYEKGKKQNQNKAMETTIFFFSFSFEGLLF